MQNYAAQDEILYHVGLSREMLKGAEYALRSLIQELLQDYRQQ